MEKQKVLVELTFGRRELIHRRQEARRNALRHITLSHQASTLADADELEGLANELLDIAEALRAEFEGAARYRVVD